MYYYIMEPSSGKTIAWQEKIKDTLGNLGIAGETVTPSAARTIEELASLGIIKGYSTIVAVGSENLVNKIVTAIINQNSSKETVLGVIPSNYDSALAKEIGVKDYKEAAQALKLRKLKTIDACLIEPAKYFLTEAVIETGRTTEAYLTLDHIKASLLFNKILIKPGLEIKIYDKSEDSTNNLKNFWAKLWGKTYVQKDIYTSDFRSKKLKLETLGRVLPVKVDNEIITKTPIACETRPQALKIVVARDTINL